MVGLERLLLWLMRKGISLDQKAVESSARELTWSV